MIGGPSLQTNAKKEITVIPPPGPPFDPTSAAEGLSVDPVTGKIVLGTVFDPLAPDKFSSDRSIEVSNHRLDLTDFTSGTANQNSLMQLASDRLLIDNGATTTGVQIQALINKLVFALFDSVTLAPTLLLSTGNNDVELINADGLVSLRCQNTALGIRVDLTSEVVIIAPPAVADNGRTLQVGGNVSIGTDFTIVGLDFPNTAAFSSSDVSSALAIGSLPGDVVMLGIDPASVLPNSCFTAWISAADTVTVRFSNYSALAQNPPAGNFKVSVIKMT